MPTSTTVTEDLLTWYQQVKRNLPWRRNKDAYRIWLSEIMLQQTRVETVIPYYERFLERFPRLEDLAAADEDDVVSLWSGLGYYRRARSLHRGAREVRDRFDGSFPRKMSDALHISGVGPYTGAAVLSIAYDLPHAVVDGNVERVITRVRRITGNPKSAVVARRIREQAGAWLSSENPGDFNQAVMDLGATICTPKSPRCQDCPIATHCEARECGDIETYPELPPRRKPEFVELDVGILQQGDRFLLEKPVDFPFLNGLYVFPLATSAEPTPGEIRPKKSAAEQPDGIAKVLSRKLGAELRIESDLPPLKHSITFRRITLRPRRLAAERRCSSLGANFRWARLEELGKTVPVSSICLKIARWLEN